MKTFILIIIFLMMYLIIQHFLSYSQEGLANCNTAQHDLISKNTSNIAANAKKIKSTVQDIQAAKKQKQAALNKAAGGL